MSKNILIQIKDRLNDLLVSSPLPLEINRELNIIYTLYRKNPDIPGVIDKHFKLVMRLTRRLNEVIFKITSINKGISKNLKAYLLSTTRDIFAVMSIVGAKEEGESGEASFLEEGIALLASQGAELSLLEAATSKKSVEVEHIIYELENELWDIARINPKIKNVTIDEIMAMEKSIETIIESVRVSKNPLFHSTGIYNLLVYIYLINLIKKVERVIKKKL